MDDPVLKIGDLLKRERIAKSKSLYELATLSGLSASHLKAIEAGNISSFYNKNFFEIAAKRYAASLEIDISQLQSKAKEGRVSLNIGVLPSLEGNLTLSYDDNRSIKLASIGGAVWAGVILVATPLLAIGLHQTLPESPDKAPSAEASNSQTGGGPAEQPSLNVKQTAPDPLVVENPLDGKFQSSVREALESWANTWANRDSEGHLRWFDSGFPNLPAYAENRRKRISQAKFIKISVSDIQILETSGNQVRIRFVQQYESDTYSSKDIKELIWTKSQNGPRIVSEIKIDPQR